MEYPYLCYGMLYVLSELCAIPSCAKECGMAFPSYVLSLTVPLYLCGISYPRVAVAASYSTVYILFLRDPKCKYDFDKYYTVWLGVGVGDRTGAGICLQLEPEPEISKMGGSGNPVLSDPCLITVSTMSISKNNPCTID